MTTGARVLMLFAAGVCSILLTSCGGGSSPAASTTGSTRPVSPRAVVSTYLTALNAGDASAALKLATPRFQTALKSEVDSPLTNWLSVEDVRVGTPRKDTAVGSARRYWRVVYVPVTFTLHQRQVVSMSNGRTTWGYVVVRDPAAGVWLIDDQGV